MKPANEDVLVRRLWGASKIIGRNYWISPDRVCSIRTSLLRSFSPRSRLAPDDRAASILGETDMPRKADPADAHLRVMEARIKAQSALVQSLNQDGQDAPGAVRRLNLLLRVLEEMRLQLPQLAETDMDKKNGRSDVLMTRLLGKEVA